MTDIKLTSLHEKPFDAWSSKVFAYACIDAMVGPGLVLLQHWTPGLMYIPSDGLLRELHQQTCDIMNNTSYHTSLHHDVITCL